MFTMDLDPLLEIANQCIHSEPPACTASCPLHVDIIALMNEIEKNDFKKAYALLESKMPLPRLIASLCEHPCEGACVREQCGGSIAIGELEKTVIHLGYTPAKKPLPLPKNKGNVAIIGGGISALCAALELDRKGYLVTIFEKTERLGGRLWEYEGEQLSKELMEEELSIIAKKGIRVDFNTEISQENLDAYLLKYDAVYLGTGEWQTSYNVNPLTFQVEQSSLFVAGTLQTKSNHVIDSASSGKRAAVSIDRYIGKTSMTASREREGVFETKLDFHIEGVTKSALTLKTAERYTEDEALLEAKRCLKCQCNECIKTCSHMQRFNITPDSYIRSIAHNERIILGTHHANKMINSCTECGLCKEVCPVGIGMADIIHATRESMVHKGKMPVSAHDFALKDMHFSQSDAFSMVRTQPSKEASKALFYYPILAFSQYVRGLYKGSGKTGYLFYPGCQLSSTHTDYIGDLYKHLVGIIKEKEAERDVGLFLGCCGAPADWAGRFDLMPPSVEHIHNVWQEMGEPTFILACSSCSATFEKYLPMIHTVSLWEILDTYGLPECTIKPGNRVLSIHDACATRHNSSLHVSIRNIAKRLGYQVEESEFSKEKTKCCGYGGLVSYAHPEQACDFAKDRKESTPHDTLVYCAMCKDMFVKENHRAYHLLDIIYAQQAHDEPQRMPTLSERQNNRKRLKARLLKEIWNETEETAVRTYDFTLAIPDEVVKLMEKRFILISDIERVVAHSREHQERFFNPQTSDYLARLRLQNVTFWVRYAENGHTVMIKDAYSHRMEVIEG
jgi:Fe-S oxidoreductase